MTKKRKLLHEEMGAPLNEGLQRLMPSRIEYGFQNEFVIDFEVTRTDGSCRLVTEVEFAKWKGIRSVGLFGKYNLAVAVAATERMYPDAGIVLKKDPKRKRP